MRNLLIGFGLSFLGFCGARWAHASNLLRGFPETRFLISLCPGNLQNLKAGELSADELAGALGWPGPQTCVVYWVYGSLRLI